MQMSTFESVNSVFQIFYTTKNEEQLVIKLASPFKLKEQEEKKEGV